MSTRTASPALPTRPATTTDPSVNRPFTGPLPFRNLRAEWRRRFGTAVYRVPIDAGFTCPNRDGRRGTGGCLFCDAAGSAARPERIGTSIESQMEKGMEWLGRRYGAQRFFAYFQSFTNTYAPVDRLRKLYDAALQFPDVIGLVVGTRPDCVPDPVLDLLQSYRRNHYVLVEFGLESVRDDTLLRMNRGHTVAEFDTAVRRTRARGLEVCAHLILGFPGEGRAEVEAAARLLNRLGVEGIKIHMLHILRHSPLERMYAAGGMELLDRDRYVALVVDLLERLDPDMVIHRLTGEAPPGRLIAPSWCLDRKAVRASIQRVMAARDSWQGKRWLPA